MDLHDIDILRFVNGIADLSQNTFNYDNEIIGNESEKAYIIQRGEEMRADLICDNLYDNVDNVDMLCNYNGIDNPLNFKEGETIFYPMESNVSKLRYSDPNLQENDLLTQSPTKTTRKDPNREEYINNNRSLPPTQLSRRIDPLTSENDDLSIGDGLF